MPSAVVGFEIAVEVVGDVAFGVVVGVYPKKTVVREVVGGEEAVGEVVCEAILLPGHAGAILNQKPATRSINKIFNSVLENQIVLLS